MLSGGSRSCRSVPASPRTHYAVRSRQRCCSGPCIADSSAVKLRPRVHRFLRGLAHFWRCTISRLREAARREHRTVRRVRVAGLAAGHLPHLRLGFPHGPVGRGWSAGGRGRFRRSDKDTVFLFDPPTERIEVEGEEDISAEEEEQEGEEGAKSGGDADEAEEDTAATGREVPDAYLHPKNLRLTDAPDESTGEGAALRPRFDSIRDAARAVPVLREYLWSVRYHHPGEQWATRRHSPMFRAC